MLTHLLKKFKKDPEQVFFERVMKRYHSNKEVEPFIKKMFNNETRETLNARFTKAIEEVKKEHTFTSLFKSEK